MSAGLAEPESLVVETPREVKTGGPGGGGPHDFEPGGRDWGGGDGDGFGPRKDERGPSAGMLGMFATMVSITALFATVIIAYAVRSQTRAYWQPVALPWCLWVSTALILASSVSLAMTRKAFRQLRTDSYGRWLFVTFLLGLGFMVSQAAALRQLVNEGVFLSQNPHSSLFYVVTAVHGVHVIGGMLALFYLICRSHADFRTQQNALGITTVYWHFLDFLWVSLFMILLLWK